MTESATIVAVVAPVTSNSSWQVPDVDPKVTRTVALKLQGELGFVQRFCGKIEFPLKTVAPSDVLGAVVQVGMASG